MAVNSVTCDTHFRVGLIGLGKIKLVYDDWEVLTANIQKLMRSKGLNKADLAKLLGVTDATVSNKLSGKRELTYKEASKIAQVLGVSLSALCNPELVPEGAELFSDPLTALEALARHLGRETRPKRNRKTTKKDDND